MNIFLTDFLVTKNLAADISERGGSSNLSFCHILTSTQTDWVLVVGLPGWILPAEIWAGKYGTYGAMWLNAQRKTLMLPRLKMVVCFPGKYVLSCFNRQHVSRAKHSAVFTAESAGMLVE